MTIKQSPMNLLHSIAADPAPMQWRGSDDGVTWTEWRALPSLDALVGPFMFYQGRVLVDGHWRTSPIGFHR